MALQHSPAAPRTRRDPSMHALQDLLDHALLRPQPAAPPPGARTGVDGDRVELSQEQLHRLLLKVASSGVAAPELSQLTGQVFDQLSAGLSPEVGQRSASRTDTARPPAQPSVLGKSRAPAAQLRQGAGPAGDASVAQQAAAAAASRSVARAAAVQAMESAAPRPTAGRRPLAPVSQVWRMDDWGEVWGVIRCDGWSEGHEGWVHPGIHHAPHGSRPWACALSRPHHILSVPQEALACQAAALRPVHRGTESRPAAAPKPGSLEDALLKGLQRFNFAEGREDQDHTAGSGFGDHA